MFEGNKTTDTVCDKNDPDALFLKGLKEEEDMLEDAMKRAIKMAEDLLRKKKLV